LADDLWVRSVLEPGVHPVRLDWHSPEDLRAICLEATVYTLSFEPNPVNAPQPLFWGYLLRIVRFRVWDKEQSFDTHDIEGRGFSHEAIKALEALRQTFLLKVENIVPETEII
jgi:hypothetical protein